MRLPTPNEQTVHYRVRKAADRPSAPLLAQDRIAVLEAAVARLEAIVDRLNERVAELELEDKL